MPTTSVSAMPRSPRYSCTQLLERGLLRSRAAARPSAWKLCRYSCAMVPIGTRPRSRASSTLDVPLKYCGTSRRKVSTTSRCQSNEKRRRSPKSNISNGCRRGGSRSKARSCSILASQPAPALGTRRVAWSKRRKYSSLTMASTKISKAITCTCGPRATISRSSPTARTLDEVALEAEDAQEVDEVALDEAQRGQVVSSSARKLSEHRWSSSR
jgi:hypothetical protein